MKGRGAAFKTESSRNWQAKADWQFLDLNQAVASNVRGAVFNHLDLHKSNNATKLMGGSVAWTDLVV